MIDLARTSSPGAIAGEILLRSGVQPPHLTLALTDEELQSSTGSFYGAWCTAHPQARECHTPVVSLDINSDFPLVAHHAGWWNLLCAEEVARCDSTLLVTDLHRQVDTDPTVALLPATWGSLGCTIVEAIPQGERWPIEVEDEHRPDGRSELIEVESPGLAAPHTGHDALNAAVLSSGGGHGRIVSATTYRPIGRQSSIRAYLDVLPDLRLDLRTDLGPQLVERRRRAKKEGDPTLAAVLRVIVNALVYGNFCRFDPIRRKVAGVWVPWDQPGPWICMPIAATVTAGSRLLLGVLVRLVRDLGGVVLYMDTDSAIVPATRCGGERVFPDDPEIRCLSWSEVDAVTAAFEPLAPSRDWPVWDIKKGPT